MLIEGVFPVVIFNKDPVDLFYSVSNLDLNFFYSATDAFKEPLDFFSLTALYLFSSGVIFLMRSIDFLYFVRKLAKLFPIEVLRLFLAYLKSTSSDCFSQI